MDCILDWTPVLALCVFIVFFVSASFTLVVIVQLYSIVCLYVNERDKYQKLLVQYRHQYDQDVKNLKDKNM